MSDVQLNIKIVRLHMVGTKIFLLLRNSPSGMQKVGSPSIQYSELKFLANDLVGSWWIDCMLQYFITEWDNRQPYLFRFWS